MSEVYLRELDPSYLVQVDTDLVYPEVLDGTTRNYGHVRYDDTGDYKIVTATTMASRNFVSQTTSDATFPMANFAFGSDKDAALIQIVDWIKFNYFHTNINLVYCFKNIGGTDYLFNFFYEGSDGTPLATQNWTPEVLNPVLWCSANQLTVDAGAGAISEWRSLTNTSYNLFTSPVGKRPIYTAKDVNYPIRLTFSGGYMITTLSSLSQVIPIYTGAFTTVIAMRGVSGNPWPYDSLTTANSRFGCYYNSNNINIFSYNSSGGGGVWSETGSSTMPQKYLAIVHNAASSKYYKDDAAVTSISLGAGGLERGLVLASRFSLGAYDPITVSEILLFTSAISDADITSIRSYLTRKFYT